MLSCIRVVSSKPLIVHVSSNGPFGGRGRARSMRVAAHRGARLDRTLQNPPAGQQQPCGQRHTSKCPGSYLGATHRARAQQRRVVLARLARTNVQGRTTRARLDRTLQNPPARQQQPCGQRHASTYPGSYLGGTHRARVQQRRLVLARLVTTDPRGARPPPLGLKLAGQTKPTLRPTSSTKAHGLQFCITHTLQSHSFMRDCRDRKFGPQMSPMEMLCPYISMLATPAISWRPRSSLARPRVVPDTPGRALHAGGVSLTRLGRPEKSTFWWPRRVVRAATRLVRQASFQCRRPCAIFGPPVASECFHMWLYA